jgi:C_GCAxxG_C_C family probable redox protein
MTLNQRIKKADHLFSGPYNCAQSVAAAFSDIVSIEEEEIIRLVSGFGYGMGKEQAVCGAVSGGIFVLSSCIEDPADREETYARVYHLIQEFKKHNKGNLNCRDLVGNNPTSEDFHSICPVLIEQVIAEVDRILKTS